MPRPHITAKALHGAATRALDVGIQTEALAEAVTPEPDSPSALAHAPVRAHAVPHIVDESRGKIERAAWQLARSQPVPQLRVRKLTPTERDRLEETEKRYSRDLKEFNKRSRGQAD